MLRICSLFILMALPLPAVAQTVQGPARVVDGDTIVIGQERIRLFAIDAPELSQSCQANGRDWPCGRWSREVMQSLTSDREVTCAGRERDRYGRLVATCSAGGEDLGMAMVLRGAAVAYIRYGDRYEEAEKSAAVAGVGIWQGTFESPEMQRAGARQPAQPVPEGSGGCVIKGNISNAGRIYHSPGQRDYDRTRIDESRGERWFCSAREAQDAGWRPARR